jgi:integrase
MSVYRMKDKSRKFPWRAVVPRKDQKPLIRQFATRAEAQLWEEEFRKRERLRDVPEYQQQIQVQELGGVSVNDLVEYYISERPSISKNDLITLKAFQREKICSKRTLDLSRQDVNRFIEKKKNDEWAAPGAKEAKSLTPRTIRRQVNLVQRVFSYTKEFRDGFASIPNPFSGIRITGATGGRRERSLEGNELERILEASKKCIAPNSYYLPLAIWLAIDTGMRRQEIFNLLWSDIDDVDRRITIRKSKTDKVMGRTNGVKIVLPVMAKHLLVTLAMIRAKKKKLKPHKFEGEQGEYEWSKIPSANERWFKFPNDDEKIFPMTARAFSQAWDKVLNRAGIEDLHFHDLRREANTRFIRAQLTLEERNLQLRHADKSMNATYVGRNALLDGIMDKLDRFTLGSTYEEALASGQVDLPESKGLHLPISRI